MAVARTTKSLTEQKFTEGSEAVGFLLLAPRGTKTGLSPSRPEGSREAAESNAERPGQSKRLDAKQIAVRRLPGSAAPNLFCTLNSSPSCKADRLVQEYTQLQLYLEV